MIHIKRSDAKEKQNSESCTVWEYELPSKKVGIATARINGRYPDKGSSVNMECDMVYFVLSGSGSITCGGIEHELREGDAFLVQTGNKYWVVGKGLFIAVVTGPAWFPEQYKELEG